MTDYQPAGLRLHAAIDMILVVFGFASPWLFGYADRPLALDWTLGLTGFGLVVNLATSYPAGLVRVLPITWHRFLEWTSPVPFIAGPWLLFSDVPVACWALTGIGFAIFANTFLIQPARTPARAAPQTV